MFARGISSFTGTWMNLGCQKRLQSTSTMTYHASCTHRDASHDIEARDQIPHPYAWGSNSPPLMHGDQIPHLLCMGIKFPTLMHGDQIPHPREG